MPESDPVTTSYEFTRHRRFAVPARRLYEAFVDPDKLERWFVVPGYRTPADRMTVDPRRGGRVSAVMISEADGSQIPFGFEYAELDPPHLVNLRFTDPDELVTITIADEPAGTTSLAYHVVSRSEPADPEAARRGVDDMLDHIGAGIGEGTI